MKILVTISRILVGSLFVVSGLIKANDPVGFSYKLEEYYYVFGKYSLLQWIDNSFFHSILLETSMFISVLEVVLGFMLLIAAFPRLVAWILLLMMIFFTFLTGFSAITGEVTDCGCFGDALKITPWQSFYKDVVLMVFVLIIFLGRKKMATGTLVTQAITYGISLLLMLGFSVGVIGWWYPVWFSLVLFLLFLVVQFLTKGNRTDAAATVLATIFTLAFTIFVYRHLPIKDFRTYKVGNNICELSEIPEDAPQPVYENILTYKNEAIGEERDFTTDEYMASKIWEDTNWVWVSTDNILVEEGFIPKIKNFRITDTDGEDITEQVKNQEGYQFILVAYNVEKASGKAFEDINALQKEAEQRDIPFFGLTASGYDDVEALRHEHQAAFPFHTSDETELKTIVRSNPGLILLKDCEIVGKWHWRDIPEWKELEIE